MFYPHIPNFPVQEIEIEHRNLNSRKKSDITKLSFKRIEIANTYIQECLTKNSDVNYRVFVKLKDNETIFFSIPQNNFLIKMPYLIEQFIMRAILQSALEGCNTLSGDTLDQIATIKDISV